ncbi:DUF2599 domain-containing protein [Dietzia sp. B32]|uniref:DUF2599 domain-containing protein n=1 Tax=Dietzia sp. B32 TaxID=2915130 RepID=UPI0021AE1D85|nr:DUF2599 domain-containing protein [Dietzia sp. B32]UVE93705.1 DUF2599 domain-containing protein [Dietzia sp. B32]
MPHRPPPGTPAAALVVVVAAALAAGACSPRAEEPAPRTARDATTERPAPTRSREVPGDTRTPPAPPFIEAATWADSDYGVTLEVAPSTAGRGASGIDDSYAAWQEVLRLVPEADAPGMWEQFDCHWTWARLLEPDKPTWNVEPWRPVVSPERMLAEGCNPGGPEV